METQKIDWSGVKKLALKSVSTDVIVIRGTEKEKTIQYEGEAPKIEKRNETLEISIKGVNSILGGIFSFGSSTDALKIEVPEDLEEISVSQVSGDVDMKSTSAEKIVLRSVSSDVKLDLVKCAKLETKTVSGDIHLVSPSVQHLVVTSVSGDIVFKNVTCERHEWLITTVSGDVNIETVGVPSITLSFRSRSGDLSSNVGYTRDGKNYLFNDGKLKMTVNSTSGDVQITATNRADRTDSIEKKILKLVADGKLSYEQAKEIIEELK